MSISLIQAYNTVLSVFHQRLFLTNVAMIADENTTISLSKVNTMHDALRDMAVHALNNNLLNATLDQEIFPTFEGISIPTYPAGTEVTLAMFYDIASWLNQLSMQIYETFMPVMTPAQNWEIVSATRFRGDVTTALSPSTVSVSNYSSGRTEADMKNSGIYLSAVGTFSAPANRKNIPHVCYYIDKYVYVNGDVNTTERAWVQWQGTTEIVGEPLLCGHPTITKDKFMIRPFTVFMYPLVTL